MKCLTGLLILCGTFSALGKTLKFDDIQHSQITLVRGVTSLYLKNNILYETGDFADFYIRSQYKPNPGPHQLPFGTIRNETDFTTRVKLPQRVSKGYWRGVVPFKKYLLMLEGRKMKVILDLNGQGFSLFSSIVVDRFSPADDSRGKATSAEVANAIYRFTKKLDKRDSGDIIFSGIVPMPQQWGGEKDRFFVLTQISGFPIFTMHCQNKDGLVCLLEHQCFVEGLNDNSSLSGIAVSIKRRQLLIASRSDNNISIMSYKSCYQIEKIAELNLPKQLHELNGVHVDHEDNLWVSTTFPDDYRNASVYKWPATSW